MGGLIYGSVIYLDQVLVAHTENPNWKFSGLLVGYILYYILFRIFDWLMFVILDCEALYGFDSIFLLDDRKNIANIVGTLFFEEFEYEEMKQYLIEKTGPLHKCRSKLVNKFGIWWWKKMGEEEFRKKQEAIVVEVKDVHTEDQLLKFMCDEERIREDFDNVQYKFYLIPKFQDGKGAICIKTHHCFTDGLGFATFFLAMSGNFDVK